MGRIASTRSVLAAIKTTSSVVARVQRKTPQPSANAAATTVSPVPLKPAGSNLQLLEARTTVRTAAFAAAEAAREAYIKASIAAGINPLPLP
jgi:hypothetical protein